MPFGPTERAGESYDLSIMAEFEDDVWDRTALRRLRAGEIDVLLEGRPLAPVLQHAGQALLDADNVRDEDLVRRCVAGLLERDAAGDDVLAMELQTMLGQTVTSEQVSWPLDPTPVDLEMLAGVLDGDPLQGGGAVDLVIGNVYPPGSLEFDRPEELDEDSESFDPDRWLFFHPESGEGYRDMLDFAAGLPDGPLREQFFWLSMVVARSAGSVTCSGTMRGRTSSRAGPCSGTSANSGAPANGWLRRATALSSRQMGTRRGGDADTPGRVRGTGPNVRHLSPIDSRM